jgi:hypothetical protein
MLSRSFNNLNCAVSGWGLGSFRVRALLAPRSSLLGRLVIYTAPPQPLIKLLRGGGVKDGGILRYIYKLRAYDTHARRVSHGVIETTAT